MSPKKNRLLIAAGLELAIVIVLAAALVPIQPRRHYISVVAQRYGYTPGRIIVNKGDTLVLSFSSLDVIHGFSLDGYPIELMAQKGMTFQNIAAGAAGVGADTNWTPVGSVTIVATQAGKFPFRCSLTCGNLHPFMTGELIVRPNSAYHGAVVLSIWIVFAVWLRQYRTPAGAGIAPPARRRDLLAAWPWLKWLVHRRSFQFLLVAPTLVAMYLLILSSLWGSPVGNRNVAIVLVWILWWFLLKAVLVPLGGRIWCLMCPLPVPAEWLARFSLSAVRYVPAPLRGLHHRFLGLEKSWPRYLRNGWLQNILFLVLISFGMILITRPYATAVLFLSILGVTVVLSLIYRQRVFCLYLCPVGGFLGTYSTVARTELRAIDAGVCARHKTKSCRVGSPTGWACPWNQYIGTMTRNTACGLCTECIKSCPENNIGFFWRPFGGHRPLKSYDALFNVIIMLVVAAAFSITMLGPWRVVRDAANVIESGHVGAFGLYLSALWGAALVLAPAMFMFTSALTNQMAGRPVSQRQMALALAPMLIPVGMFAWIAFSLPTVMINYGYIVSVISDPLGWGWNLFGTATMHPPPFLPAAIPWLQGLILLAGLHLGIRHLPAQLTGLGIRPEAVRRVMVIPALLALITVNVFLYLYMG